MTTDEQADDGRREAVAERLVVRYDGSLPDAYRDERVGYIRRLPLPRLAELEAAINASPPAEWTGAVLTVYYLHQAELRAAGDAAGIQLKDDAFPRSGPRRFDRLAGDGSATLHRHGTPIRGATPPSGGDTTADDPAASTCQGRRAVRPPAGLAA